MAQKINTPCVGICSTVYGDDICQGCRRTAIEVIEWNKYPEEKKEAIICQLGEVIQSSCHSYFIVEDSTLLKNHLETNSIRYFSYQDPLCWAYYALRNNYQKQRHLVFPEIGCVGKTDKNCFEIYTIIEKMVKEHYSL